MGLPNNRKQVKQKLMSHEKQFSHGENYSVFMKRFLKKGYVVVQVEKVHKDDGRVWYLPPSWSIPSKAKRGRE